MPSYDNMSIEKIWKHTYQVVDVNYLGRKRVWGHQCGRIGKKSRAKKKRKRKKDRLH